MPPTPSPASCWPSREVKPIGLGARDLLRLEAGPLPLRPRHRHHHDADRSGPAVEHRQGAPRAGRLPRRRRHPEADRRGRAAQARRPAARGQGDRARGRRDRHRRQDGRQGHVGRLRADARARRSPWATSSAPTQPTAPRSILWCAASPCRPRSCPCLSSNTPTTADRSFQMADTRYTKEHEWLRVEGDVGTIGITEYAQEQLGDVVFVDVPAGRPQGRQGRGLRRGRIGEGGVRHLRAGVGRGGRGQCGASPTRRATSTPSRWARAGSSRSSFRDKGELVGPDGRGGLQRFREKPGLNTMRYLPLTPTDRRDMLGVIGAQVGRRAVQGRAGLGAPARQGRGPARSSRRARGRARLPGLCRPRTSRRPRRRSSSAPAPIAITCRRPSTT